MESPKNDRMIRLFIYCTTGGLLFSEVVFDNKVSYVGFAQLVLLKYGESQGEIIETKGRFVWSRTLVVVDQAALELIPRNLLVFFG